MPRVLRYNTPFYRFNIGTKQSIRTINATIKEQNENIYKKRKSSTAPVGHVDSHVSNQ